MNVGESLCILVSEGAILVMFVCGGGGKARS